jgi:hypothetical protein
MDELTVSRVRAGRGRTAVSGEDDVNSNRVIRASSPWTRRGVVRGRLRLTRGPEP